MFTAKIIAAVRTNRAYALFILFVAILPQAFFPLMCGDFMAFFLLSARHIVPGLLGLDVYHGAFELT